MAPKSAGGWARQGRTQSAPAVGVEAGKRPAVALAPADEPLAVSELRAASEPADGTPEGPGPCARRPVVKVAAVLAHVRPGRRDPVRNARSGIATAADLPEWVASGNGGGLPFAAAALGGLRARQDGQ